uniref:Kinesin-like protein n=1 Tax=Romanomermis culicivorax TaxID=13658 RepID=A0A915JI18_ROMCU
REELFLRLSQIVDQPIGNPFKNVDQDVASHFKVAVRVRPLTNEERSNGDTQVVYRVDEKMVILMDPGEDLTDVLRQRRTKEKRYMFDVAFGPEAAQKEVYGNTTHQLVESILQGYNATVFAYGATGAGKTFTMVGTEKNPGIMVRALDDLFSMIQTFNKSELRYSVKMSYMEIYNEIIRDLLQPSSDIVDIREDSAGAIQVAGLSEVQATSSKEVLNLLLHGNMRRTQEPTAANKTSSRSHAILQVTVVQSKKLSGEYVKNSKTVGRLFLIDLAGSERASHTKNTGQRLKEGAHINRSLLALGNVINTLTEKGAKFVNYRDSKLTRLLKDSLGGHNRTVMIANISPASSQYEESKTTLIYANRAKNIINNVSKNSQDLSRNDTQYQSIVSELRKEIERLRLKIDKQNRIIQTLPPIHRNSSKNDASHADMNSPLILAQTKLSKGIDSLPPVNLSDEYIKLKGEFIVLFQEQLRLRHQLTECDDKAYQLKFQIAKKEIELKLLNDGASRNFYQSSGLRNSVDAAKIKLKELESRKQNIKSEISENRKKAKELEQSMPEKINTAEQREMWSLLFRLHDSEIDKAVLQADALLLNRRLDRQENSLEKVTNNTYIGRALVEEQKKILTASRIPQSQKALELYKAFENTSKEVVIAQKTLEATNQAELQENRLAIADRIQ